MPLVPFPEQPRRPTPAPARRPSGGAAVGMLLLRPAGLAAFQVLVAAMLALRGVEDPWQASAAFWPVTAILTNLLSIALLSHLMGKDGTHLQDLIRMDPRHGGKAVPAFLVVLVLGTLLAVVPSVAMAVSLFMDPQQAVDLVIQPLPTWAAIGALVLLPVTTALAELPLYHGFVMPRLAASTGRGWGVVPAVALVHALQHAALPLVFDAPFLLWRGLMFLPVSLLVAAALFQRPRLLPYLVVTQGLIALQVAWLVLQASLG